MEKDMTVQCHLAVQCCPSVDGTREEQREQKQEQKEMRKRAKRE